MSQGSGLAVLSSGAQADGAEAEDLQAETSTPFQSVPSESMPGLNVRVILFLYLLVSKVSENVVW